MRFPSLEPTQRSFEYLSSPRLCGNSQTKMPTITWSWYHTIIKLLEHWNRIMIRSTPPALSFSSTRELFYKRDRQRQEQLQIHGLARQRAVYTVSGIFRATDLPVPVIGLDVVGEGLGLLGSGVVVTVVVVVYIKMLVRHHLIINGNSKHTGVRVLLGSNVVQLDDIAALVAALKGALAGYLVHQISICDSRLEHRPDVRSAS